MPVIYYASNFVITTSNLQHRRNVPQNSSHNIATLSTKSLPVVDRHCKSQQRDLAFLSSYINRARDGTGVGNAF